MMVTLVIAIGGRTRDSSDRVALSLFCENEFRKLREDVTACVVSKQMNFYYPD